VVDRSDETLSRDSVPEGERPPRLSPLPPPAPDEAARTAVTPPAIGRGAAEVPGPPPEARLRRVEGRYRIEKPLGEGGMGTVYRAFDRELGRPVALKVLHAPLAGDRELAARFIEEAQMTAQLQHRAIVPVHELAIDAEGRLFFVMKLVRGHTLSQVIDEVRGRARREGARESGEPDVAELTLFRLLEALVEVARAVHYAHERGVVHRDIKPLNIMIGEYGEVHLMDWGLAKAVGSASGAAAFSRAPARGADPLAGPASAAPELVRTDSQRAKTLLGAVFGTPAYMPPEQAEGGAAAAGPLADVYGLGATLFHILTGQPPFMGTNDQVLAQVKSPAAAPRARELDPFVPRELDAIAAKAISKRPHDRYPSAKAFADDLQAYLEGRPVAAYPEGLFGRAKKFAWRHSAATATAALALVFGFAGALAALIEIEGARRRAEVEHARAEAGRREADVNLGRVFREMGRRALQAKDVLAAELLLAKSLTLEDRRETREALLEARARGARIVWSSPAPSGGTGIDWSPDGSLFAAVLEDRTIRLWDGATFREIRALASPAPVTSLAFSPDGKALAAAMENGAVAIWDVAAGALLRSIEAHQGGRCWAAAWSPDGKRLATGGEDRMVRIFDAALGREIATSKGHGATVYGVAFRPDGRELASGSWDGTVRLWNAADGKPVATIERPVGWVMSVAYSPDGKLIAAGNDQTTVTIYNGETHELLATLRGHERAVEHLSFARDGRMIATSSADGTARLWEIESEREILSLRCRRTDDQGIGIAFSPDQTRLALAGFDRRIEVREIAGGDEVRTLRGHERPAAGVAFSPDGKRLATSGWDGTLRLWDAASGTERAVLCGHEDKVELISWGRLGRTIASGGWDKTVRIWDAREAKERKALRGHESWVADVSLSPDESLVASASEDGTVRIWDIDAGKERWILEGHVGGVLTVAFAPEGRRVVSGGADHTARVWDIATGAELFCLRGHAQDIEGVAFSPDGARIATGSWDRTVRIWDAATGRVLHVLHGHDGWVYGVAWSPDGKLVASASEDGTVRVWDALLGRPFLVCRGHGGEVQAVAFSPDGERVASSSYDGTVRIWDLPAIRRVMSGPPQKLVEEAEEHTGLRLAELEKAVAEKEE
jgi:WD40 repeat protein/serine/threonine protein kinase